MSSSREYNYDSFANKLLEFAKNLVIKNNTRAQECEDTRSLKNATQYILAYECADTFNSHSDWTEWEMQQAGMTNENIQDYLENKIDIPSEFKEKLLTIRRERICAEYVEYNNYYRMLNGLPNYGETGVMTSYNKPTEELTEDETYHLLQGEIEELKLKYPDKEYLKYLGNENKVDFYTARKASNYEILNYKKYIIEEQQAAKFQEFYYQCRQYVIIANYSKAYTQMYYYDAFIILLIVFMSLQRYINETYNFAIRKDFYDMEDIKNSFLSFGLPFFPEIPIKYQRNIVKNLNKLLKYKGTDKCLVDIVKLFGFNNVDLYKYYLIKDIKRDKYGNPDINVYDKELTYELKFAQVPFETTDITEALQKTTMYQSYEEIVADDPFWGGNYSDDNNENVQKFKDELINLEFNYLNTKYLAVNTMFDVSKNNLDLAYFFNLINTLQVNGNLSRLTFISKDIKPSGNSIRLFDAISAVYYLLCKKFQFEDNILKTSTSAASIYDFKFDKDMNILLNNIESKACVNLNNQKMTLNKNKLQDEDIQQMKLNNRYLNNAELVDLYFKNADYRDFLIERMNNTEDYLEYKTLLEIYNYNMISDSVTNAYGEYTTYSDYLKDNDAELFTYIEDNSQNNNSLNLTISNILYAIESNLNSFRFDDMFASLSSLSGDIVKSYIMKMINVFKAYTVELKRLNIYFVFDEKFMNRLKMLNFLYIQSNMTLSSGTLDEMLEDLIQINKIIHNSKIGEGEEFLLELLIQLEDKLEILLKEKFNIDFVLSDGMAMDSSEFGAKYGENTIINSKTLVVGDKLFNDYTNKTRLYL